MNRKTVIAVVILLVAGLALYMNSLTSVPEGYVDYQAVEAQSALADNPDVRILDVRTPAEFKAGHIKGAENIDFRAKNFEERLSTLDKDARYFIYCRTGNRSGAVLGIMRRLGFSNVWHLKHGVVDWGKSGLPLVQ